MKKKTMISKNGKLVSIELGNKWTNEVIGWSRWMNSFKSDEEFLNALQKQLDDHSCQYEGRKKTLAHKTEVIIGKVLEAPIRIAMVPIGITVCTAIRLFTFVITGTIVHCYNVVKDIIDYIKYG